MAKNIRKTALLLVVLSHFDRVLGRIRLQKMIYLANLCGWNVIRDHVFYEYGPYSDWISRELQNLVENDFVKEERELDPLDEKTPYEYRLTEAGKSLINQMINEINEPDLIARTQKLLDILREIPSEDLEIMTSLVFLRIADPEKDDDTLVRLVKYYKPRFNEDRIRKAFKIFDILKPLTIS